MKEGWEIRKLGELGAVVGGSTPRTNVPSYWGEGYYWITPAELDGSKYVGATARTITDEALKNTNLTLLPIGTVLLSSRAPIGKVAITTSPMFCNQGFKNIICGPEIINEYVYWFLIHNKDYLVSLGRGATFKEISKHIVEQVSIPVPPIAEQEKIVAELDCLTGIIEKKKRQLEELDKLAKSIFYDMFGGPISNEKGWTVKLVRDIANVKIGPFGSLLHAADYITGGCPVINPIHMREGRICAEADFTVSEEKRKEMSSYLLERDDIIFGRRGDIGRCALVSATEAGYICGTGSLVVRFTAPIIPIFALNVFMSNEMKDLLVGQAKGATMLNINCGIVELLPVIFPPLDRQNEFAKKIEAIEKQKELVKRSIVETETLFNSRMDYWFN